MLPDYIADFLDAQHAQLLYRWLANPHNVCWRREQFSLYGRQVNVPRQLAWYGDQGVNYRYTGLDHLASGWPEYLAAIKSKVNMTTNLDFNFVLLNRYDHGQEYMGWHRDDEKCAAPVIASLSLGATRRFRYRPDADSATQAFDLQHGSLLIFDGRCQHTLTKTVKHVGTRFNLTFRCISPRFAKPENVP